MRQIAAELPHVLVHRTDHTSVGGCGERYRLHGYQLTAHDLRRQLKRRQEFSNRCLETDFNALPQLACRQEYGQQRTLTGCEHDLLMSEPCKVYIPIAESRTRLNGRRKLRRQA